MKRQRTSTSSWTTSELHDFDSDDSGDGVSASGDDFTIHDIDALTLGAIEVSGDLVVVPGTILTDTPSEAVVVGGSTSILGDVDVDIILDNLDHDLHGDDSGESITATGADITIADIGPLVLRDFDAKRNLTVTSGSTIADEGATGEDIDVAGVTSLSASGSITLDDLFNDFDTDDSGDSVGRDGDGPDVG